MNIRNPFHPELSLGMKYSLVGHFILAMLVFIKAFEFRGHPQQYIPTLKVDLVALPDVLKKDLRNPGQSQFKQEIESILKKAEKDAYRIKTAKTFKNIAQKDEMALGAKEKGVERKNKRALDRIKAFAKLEEDPKESNQLATIKGNKISKGSSLAGEARESAEANYKELLRDRIQENWSLPTWISRQALVAQVQVHIDAKGRIQSLKFVKPSGNSQFDDAVKKALQESQPLPFPPEDLAGPLLSDGILLGFPL